MKPVQIITRFRKKRNIRSRKSSLVYSRQMSLGCSSLLLLICAMFMIAGGWIFASLSVDLPSLETLPLLLDRKTGLLLEPTRFYDRRAEQVIYTLQNEGIPRKFLAVDPTQADCFSPQFSQMMIQIYDETYWQNPGFMIEKIFDERPVTIAERLVDDVLLSQEPAGIRRNIRMRILAGQIIARYGRVQVLEWFLNSAYFGHLAYGADNAARLYLNKSASAINLAEGALLVALYETPALNPLDAPTAAQARMQETLLKLSEAKVINSREYDQWKSYVLPVSEIHVDENPQAFAFTHLALEQIEERFSMREIERGGVTVITTLDLNLQEQAICTGREQIRRARGIETSFGKCETSAFLPALSGQSDNGAALNFSVALTDIQSGELLALVGDSDGQTEPTLKMHQPGSLLSPFLAVAAYARGFSPATLVWDIPQENLENGVELRNPDGKYHGPARMRNAIANDYLAGLTALAGQIGNDSAWMTAVQLGMNRLLADTKDPSRLLYQGGETTVLDITQAYSVFPGLGSQKGFHSNRTGKINPATIIRVEKWDGVETWQPILVEQPLISSSLAYLVHHVLADETARRKSLGFPNAFEIGRPVGAKLGQLEDENQVWAVGYSAQRLLTVWLGYESSLQGNPTGNSGGALDPHLAMGLWQALMQTANKNLPITAWVAPQGISFVDVCDPSGLLPTRDCPQVVNEIFLAGFEPVTYDTLYKVYRINRATGLLATVFTPIDLVEEHAFISPPPEARAWVEQAGLALAPVAYDAVQKSVSLPDVQIISPDIFAYVHGSIPVQGIASGNDFSSYQLQIGQGLNPRDWVNIGGGIKPVTDGQLGSWDTTSSDEGLYAMRLMVVRGDQSVETALTQVTVDNTPPNVKITSPVDGEQIVPVIKGQITLTAEANDSIGIDHVEWIVDGKSVGVSLSTPYDYVLQVSQGEHRLIARAYDVTGNSIETEPIKFSVLE